VAAFGEFGRGPMIDKWGGRGHWARAWHTLLSGGGEPQGRGFSMGDLLATIYHSLEIDPSTTRTDRQSRPIRIVDQGQPIRELF